MRQTNNKIQVQNSKPMHLAALPLDMILLKTFLLLTIFFEFASALSYSSSYNDRAGDVMLATSCSSFENAETQLVELGQYPEGYLISNFRHENGSAYEKRLPLGCTWQIFQSDIYGKDWAVKLQFEEFDIPDDSTRSSSSSDNGFFDNGSSDGVFTYSELIRSSPVCRGNFVKISYDDAPDKPLGVYCGSGWIPDFQGENRRSVLVQAEVNRPYNGFKIRFSRATAQTRFNIEADACPDTYFMCTGHSGRCVPRQFQCDGNRDCPLGDDENNCTSLMVATDIQPRASSTDSGCGSNRYQDGTSGSFSSNSFPCPYSSDSRCIWYIQTDPGKDLIVAFNTLFSVEPGKGVLTDDCPFDGITIYAHNSSTNVGFSVKFLRRLCGRKAPAPILLRTNSLLVIFESDSSGNEMGFRLNWAAIDRHVTRQLVDIKTGKQRPGRKGPLQLVATTTLPPPPPLPMLVLSNPACSSFTGVTLQGTSGVARSPGFGEALGYPPSVTCRWIIRPVLKPGQAISHFELRFYDLMIQPSQSCSLDALHVRHVDRYDPYRRRDVAFCDSNRPALGEAVVFRANAELELIFQSDGSVEERGFELGYTAIVERPELADSSKTPKTHPRDTHCGRTYVKPPARSLRSMPLLFRIVGGTTAKPGSWPFVVELLFRRFHLCGATIISNQWLVTAAHCFNKEGRRQKRGWQVVIGRQTVYSPLSWDHRTPVQYAEIKNIYVHSKFGRDSTSKEFDIAMVHLKQPLVFGKFASSVCLPSRDTRTSDRCFVVGWGETKGTGGEGLLKQAHMPILPNSACRAMNIYYNYLLADTMICAGYEAGGTDACQGDSGGPLLCMNDEKRWELHGIVSWGKGCAGWRAPGIYTRVYRYVNFIRKIMAAFH